MAIIVEFSIMFKLCVCVRARVCVIAITTCSLRNPAIAMFPISDS